MGFRSVLAPVVEPVVLAGGDLTNTGAAQNYALQRVVVTSSSTVDGTGLLDIRKVTFASPGLTVNNGATLTKNGANSFDLADGAVGINNGSIVVNNGTFGIYNGGVTSGTGTYTINSSGTLDVSSWVNGPTTLTNGVTVNGGTLLCRDATNGASAISGTVAFSSTSTINGQVAYNLTGIVSGTGSLTKTSAGTLTLSNDNTYSGSMTISAGGVQIGNGGATGSLPVSSIADNAALTFNHTGSKTFAGTISGTGTLTRLGAGTDIFTNDLTHSGGTTISAGVMQIGAGGTSGTVSGAIANSGTIVFNRSDASTYSGAISGTGALQLTAGTLTMSGSFKGIGFGNDTCCKQWI